MPQDINLVELLFIVIKCIAKYFFVKGDCIFKPKSTHKKTAEILMVIVKINRKEFAAYVF